MQIFVGSLSFSSTKVDVRKLFEQFGTVDSVTILMNKNGKKSRGFGFVEMPDEHNARVAIAGLDNKEFMGRVLKVMAARPKPIKEPVVEEKRERRFRPEAEKRQNFRPETRSPDRFQDRPFPRKKKFEPDAVFKPVAIRPSRFKGGRRSTSYLRRITGRADAPFQAGQEAPERPWQKKRGPAKPWLKPGEHAKPWRKSSSPAKPWSKPGEHAKPWQKSEAQAKPWLKPGEHAKPWRKSSSPAPRSGFKHRTNNGDVSHFAKKKGRSVR